MPPGPTTQPEIASGERASWSPNRPPVGPGGDIAEFTRVDLAPDARFFVEFMDAANALPDIRRLKPLLAKQLRLSRGDRVLDVGCGTGDDALALVALVGDEGTVVGIDPSETMIEVARERARAAGLAVDFALGDALALDFPDEAFTACRCERVLMHLDGDPAGAIEEIVRVTRRGGRVAISDFYWDGLVFDHPDRVLTRAVVHAVSDGIRHGLIGSQLPRLMADAGLLDIEIEGHAVRFTHPFLHRLLDGHLKNAREEGRLSEADVAEWWRPIDEAAAAGQMMAAHFAFLAAGAVSGS
jgi:SAM-dependent methyltransferase